MPDSLPFSRRALLTSVPVAALPERRIRAVAFDGFTIFDPRSVAKRAEEVLPGRGAALAGAWRTRQFEYTWLRSLTGSYADFWQVTGEALTYAAKEEQIPITRAQHAELMSSFLTLKAWPDAPAALRRMKEHGLRLALLCNFTVRMLDAAVGSAGLGGLFEPHLSTDRVGVFKPAPAAYRMAVEAFGLERDEIAFAAFGGWDAAGAKRFGFPTFWVNRLSLPVEELGVAPDAQGPGLDALMGFSLAARR
ncbi:MAG: haloacid dehalogenase type II [Paludibaculum sp.]